MIAKCLGEQILRKITAGSLALESWSADPPKWASAQAAPIESASPRCARTCRRHNARDSVFGLSPSLSAKERSESSNLQQQRAASDSPLSGFARSIDTQRAEPLAPESKSLRAAFAVPLSPMARCFQFVRTRSALLAGRGAEKPEAEVPLGGRFRLHSQFPVQSGCLPSGGHRADARCSNR